LQQKQTLNTSFFSLNKRGHITGAVG